MSHSKQSPIGTEHGHNDPPRRVWTQRFSLSMLQNSNQNLKQHVLSMTGYSTSKKNTPLYLSLLLTRYVCLRFFQQYQRKLTFVVGNDLKDPDSRVWTHRVIQSSLQLVLSMDTTIHPEGSGHSDPCSVIVFIIIKEN